MDVVMSTVQTDAAPFVPVSAAVPSFYKSYLSTALSNGPPLHAPSSPTCPKPGANPHNSSGSHRPLVLTPKHQFSNCQD
jgi:hypothetical protein